MLKMYANNMLRFIDWFLLLYIALLILHTLPPILKYLRNKEPYKKLKFTFCITFIFIVGTLFNLLVLHLNLKQHLVYFYFFLVTLLFIKLVRKIKNNCDSEERITEFQFFIFIFGFIFILIGYISGFSLLYFQSIPEADNGYISQNGIVRVLDMRSSILLSGFTFFSMEFAGLTPQGLLAWFSLLEVAVAEIAIILFIGIIAGELYQKLSLL